MARVRFLADHTYRPSGAPRVQVAYKAGKTYTVKRECADEAVAAGRALDLDKIGWATRTRPGAAPDETPAPRARRARPLAAVADAPEASPRARPARVRHARAGDD